MENGLVCVCGDVSLFRRCFWMYWTIFECSSL